MAIPYSLFQDFTILRELWEKMESALELFNSVQISLEASFLRHKSLARLHAEVCQTKKLGLKTAVLIGQTMAQQKSYRSKADSTLLEGKQKKSCIVYITVI